jgi:2-phospho-L-lactate guanylyltransferase
VKRPAWAIVPAKSLARGKSRLRPVLDDPQRVAFARELLEHVLGVLGACSLDGLMVCTDGEDVAQLAAARGAHVRRDAGGDSGPGALARVVDGALADVAWRGARTALVLMADLPRVEPGDVAAVLAALDEHDVAVVRDHLGRHTNALALAPPTAIATRFGSGDSFAEHCAAARAAGLRLAVVESGRIAFDVDGPADHAAMTPSPGAGSGSGHRA